MKVKFNKSGVAHGYGYLAGQSGEANMSAKEYARLNKLGVCSKIGKLSKEEEAAAEEE